MSDQNQQKRAFYRHLAQTSDHPMGLVIERAEGPWIYSTDGKRYLDLISGIAVSSLGHRHPAVLTAIRSQLDRHLHVMVYGEFIQQAQVDFVTLLSSRLPDKLQQIYLVNSGTEANEGALKLARKHTGRSRFVSFHNSYHGDTMGSLSVTGRDIYREPFEPLLPDVHFIDFNCSERIRDIDETTAAVILEPIQGEGGVIPANPDWLHSLRERCNETGALLIFDEIQTGYFRTGSLFAFEQYDVVPDILTMAKAMGGGMPIGAFVSSPEIFRAFRQDPPLNHVTTFGGHPVSAAAAHATLKELLSGGYGTRAERFETIARKSLTGPGIRELRGRGAMLGLELESGELARDLVAYCFEQELILGWTLHSDHLIRIAPPLILEEKLFERALETILTGLKQILT